MHRFTRRLLLAALLAPAMAVTPAVAQQDTADCARVRRHPIYAGLRQRRGYRSSYRIPRTSR